MKYKIIKPIGMFLYDGMTFYDSDNIKLTPKMLVEMGYAEEIKDDIDIEAIRRMYQTTHVAPMLPTVKTLEFLSEVEIDFFTAYRIVKSVIDQLNSDWKPDEETQTYEIYWYGSREKMDTFPSINTRSINPLCKDRETAQRVIELCDKELKVLFGVKK